MVPSITDQQSSKPNRPWANLGQLAVLAVWILCEPHLPWITVEPNSMSKGIQSVLNHHSKRREGGEGGGIQLCLSILWTASMLQHPKLKVPHTHAHSPSNAYSIRSTHSHMLTSKQTHFLNTLTHALITHAFPLPTVTGKQCPPLPSQCTPPLPSLHFSSHQLCSSPFLLCCGSCDRGIPSLLTPLMG